MAQTRKPRPSRRKPRRPRDTRRARDRSAAEPFPVVAMGASAGGLEALQKFFAAMPPNPGMAFVLAQHLDPRHVTLMPELLGRTTAMPVEQVRDRDPRAGRPRLRHPARRDPHHRGRACSA